MMWKLFNISVLHEFECIVSNGLAVKISHDQMQWDGVFSAMATDVLENL